MNGQKTITLQRDEYDDMLEYMLRLQETAEILSNNPLLHKLAEAKTRIEKGEFLTKKELMP